MTLPTFLIHFFYIAGTFVAGFALGFLYKEKVQSRLNRLFKRRD